MARRFHLNHVPPHEIDGLVNEFKRYRADGLKELIRSRHSVT